MGLLTFLRGRGAVPLILGNGTNILADDRGFDAVAVKTAGVCSAEVASGVRIVSGAGASLRALAALAEDSGLSGLEFAHGIPGTLGGAIVMNAGAYGGQMSDVVASVRTILPSPVGGAGGRTPEDLDAAKLGFGYRASKFSQRDGGAAGVSGVIISSVLELRPAPREAIRAKMEELAELRKRSQPLELPSAGSAFKRPSGGYAARLIDMAGLRGYALGGAQVSRKHTGFVVNAGGASFDDVVRLMEYIRGRVLGMFGVELDPEIKILRRGADGGFETWKF
jgi:UDP-N-acetylmuramate dehydrogenase